MSLDSDNEHWFNFTSGGVINRAPLGTDNISAGYAINDVWYWYDTGNTPPVMRQYQQIADGVWQYINPIYLNNGQAVVEGNLLLQGGLILPPSISVNINANTNNLVIPGITSGLLVRFIPSGNHELTGIIPATTSSGSVLFGVNKGTGNLTLKVFDGASNPNNRFSSASNKKIQPNEAFIAAYDTISLKHQIFATAI